MEYNKNKIEKSLKRLLNYVNNQDYIGFDPYDGLYSKIFSRIDNRFIEKIIIHTNKNFPLNFRPFIGIKKGLDNKALALFAIAYFKLYKLDEYKKQYLHAGENILKILKKKSLRNLYSFDSWSGHYFRTTELNPSKPDIVSTAFCGEAFLQYYNITQNRKLLKTLREIVEFYLSYLLERKNNISYFMYYPKSRNVYDKRIVYNAVLLGLSLLSKLSNYISLKEVQIIDIMNFIVSRQNPDGSWYYSLNIESGKERKQIDFHQGFILDSIHDFIKFNNPKDNKYTEALLKGTEYYKNKQFLPDGRCKWRWPRVWPIDIHNQAQGIITFSKLSELNSEHLDFSKIIAQWTIENMQDEKGYFYYQKRPLLTNKIPYMRWGQAWMAVALATLLEAIENSKQRKI